MKKKVLAVTLGAAMLAGSLAGCGEKAPAPGATTAAQADTGSEAAPGGDAAADSGNEEAPAEGGDLLSGSGASLLKVKEKSQEEAEVLLSLG